jgi:hypothetical protein
MAISGNASMNPMNAPIAAPERKVIELERAPIIAVITHTRAATPTPIQKMEGIKSAPYRTDKWEEFPKSP